MMKRFSIGQYVAWLTLLPLLIMAIGMASYFLQDRFAEMEKDLQERAGLVVHQLALSSEYGVFSNNMEFLHNIAKGALQQSDIRGVAILDANARVLASSGQLSSTLSSEMLQRNMASQLLFAQAGVVDEPIVLQPAGNNTESLWLYHAIVPAQIALDDLGTKANVTPTGLVIVEISKVRHIRDKNNMLAATLFASMIFVSVVLYLVYVASRRITHPIRELSEAVQAIGAGRLNTRVSLDTKVVELATLAEGLNSTTEHLEREQEILQQCIEDATLALREKKEEAERASHDKSRFLAVASHDLRQPLHALGLYVAELQRKLSGTDQQYLAEQIEHSVEALASLLNALLDISKLDAGAVIAQMRICSIDTMLRRIERDYHMLAEVKNIRLVVRPCIGHVISDPLLMERILSNLVSNAIRYTNRNGRVLVACRRRGKFLRIEVRDNGTGISKADQANIFREFVQLAQPQLDTGKGLGLGLAIVERLVKLLGHRIELHSSPGRGSVFALEVPIAASPGKTSSATAAPLNSYTGDEPSTEISTLAGKRVLVVDDDQAVLSGTANALRSWKCEVSAAASVAEVEKLIRDDTEWDFIVTDYQLENGRTGIGVIDLVRQHQNRQVPCLLITGDTSQAVVKLVSVSGYQLLHKPVRPAKLRSLIMHLLENSYARTEPPGGKQEAGN